MSYDYYLQEPENLSLRRYPIGSETGQRWEPRERTWTDKCAPRSCCITTTDRLITPAEAEQRFPGSVAESEVTA